MGWNGSGTFNRSDGTRSGTQVWQDAKDSGVKIRADDHDTHDQEIADGLENTVTLDGQNTTTTDNSILRYDSGNTQFEGVSISDNELVGRSGGDVTGVAISASEIVGRSASGNIRSLSASTARQTIGIGTAASDNNSYLVYSSASNKFVQTPIGQFDPEHATDSGTDTYVSATNTTAPADGVNRTRDFQSANTTTTPTLDGKTITDRDDNALWSDAINGVHKLQYASGSDTYLLLDPIGTSDVKNNSPVKRNSSGLFSVNAPTVGVHPAHKNYVDAGDPTLETAVDATNGGADDLTEIDFTGIKSGANRIVVELDQISLSGTDDLLVQIGDSGGFETSGYTSAGGSFFETDSVSLANSTSGFVMQISNASANTRGAVVLERFSGNKWIAHYSASSSPSPTVARCGGGRKELSAELDRVRITTTGTDTFDLGNINLMVE